MNHRMRFRSLRIRAVLALATALVSGCGQSPPPVAPTPAPTAPVAVAPPVVTPPVVAPPVLPPSSTTPTTSQASPAPVQTSTPPSAPVTNAHPDLVVFGFLWSPKGPYDADYEAANRPKLAPAENDAVITQVLKDLDAATDDPAAQEKALTELKRANRNEARRAEVSQHLEPLLDSNNLRVKILATHACSTWGTSANLPTLKKLAEQDDPHFSNDAVWAIYRTADISQAAPYLALPVCFHGAQKSFLQHRAGEEHVWPLLSSSNPTVVFNALGALMHVGTPQSVGHLTPLHKHPDLLVSRTSQAVVNQIQRRQQ